MPVEEVVVKLITPLMLGSAEARHLDLSGVLRPPAVRGMLRFWLRALICGVKPGISSTELAELEFALLGGLVQGKSCSSVVAVLPPTPALRATTRRELFPHKLDEHARSKTLMFLEGVEVTLRLRGINRLSPDQRQAFCAALWTWLHLGSIGRRSRRGFGSLQWIPKPGDLLASYQEDLGTDSAWPGDRIQLEDYLRNALSRALGAMAGAIGAYGSSVASAARGANPDCFAVGSTDQVFVGTPIIDASGKSIRVPDDRAGGIIERLHGLTDSALKRGPERDELGFARGKRRLASPIYLRMHVVSGEFIPVMTWSPRTATRITTGSGLAAYLASLGFRLSLVGNPF